MWIVWMQTCNWFMYVDPRAYKNLVIFRNFVESPTSKRVWKQLVSLKLFNACFTSVVSPSSASLHHFLVSQFIPFCPSPLPLHVTCILAHSPPSLIQFLVSWHPHKYKLEIGSAHEIRHVVLVIFFLGSWLIVFKILISRPINLNAQFIFLCWG